MPRCILYIDMWIGDCVQEMKLAGIRRFADMRGWKVQVVPEKQSRPDDLRKLFTKNRPLGCVVECSASHDDLRPGLFTGIPTVWLDCRRGFCGGKPPMVVHDGEATARVAFHELAANRPTAYAVVGYVEPRNWARIRERVFRLLAVAEGKRCYSFVCRKESSASRAKRMYRFVEGLPRRTAVFAVNDNMALEVVDACRRMGKSIPADMTIMGVDNLASVCEDCTPSISSIQIDFELAGYRAASLLDALVIGRSSVANRTMFGPLMTVRRESTRGFGRREPRLMPAVDLIRREACSGLKARDVLQTITGSRRLAELRFREMMGHSILDEIMSVRLEKVCFLLSRTDTAIGAIAAQCGFGSNIALSKLFKRRFGMSLLSWRNANRELRPRKFFAQIYKA